jgi:type IV secretory pathway ATPase VirB11/archaellum biosynthesis ATPase
VTFGGPPEERDGGWTGDEWPASPLDLSDKTFAAPPSTLVTMTDRTTVNVDRLLGRTLDLAKPRLALPSGRVGRDEALRAIDAAVDEVMRGEKLQVLTPEERERLVLMALSDICGLGLIDRLWADHSVRGVFVNGPKSVFVEREGGLGPASEVFRDQAHLLELVNRLVTKPASGVAEFHLRDGSTGTVVFPPAAPEGPVLTIRRSAPGSATLGRLVTSGLLDLQMAGLLRVAARARLNIAVLGSAGAGKTALLAAIARDLDSATRLVTLSRHRDFDWSAPGKVELVASRAAPYATLLVAGEKLQPEAFILDSFPPSEAPAVLAVLERGAKGLVMAYDPAVTPLPGLTRSVDVVVRLGRGRDGAFLAISLEDATGAPVFVHEDGKIQCRTREPAFARKVRDAGFSEALATLLR